MLLRRLLLVFLVLPFGVCAQNLEQRPERDLEEVDNAVAQMAKEFIKKATLSEAFGAPHLDGVLDDEFWEQAESLEITKALYPIRFADAIVKTDVLVAITRTHLYLGFTAHDPDPEKIRSFLRERDATKEDDYVSIIVDPIGNLLRKFEFRVNPHGVLSDVLQNPVSNRYIYDWDTLWDAAANITPTGYVVEMAIPYDSIKHTPAKEGEIPKWVTILKRSYPRAVDRTFGAIYILERAAEAEPIKPEKKLELIPHYIFHPDEKRKKGEPFEQVKDVNNHDVGMDVKLILDPATTVSATIRPNYTEVEADIARDSISNPFVPFQPEKRKFFQDGRDLYATYMPIVYSRQILQPKFGLNYYSGKKVSTGGFWVSDEGTKLIMPDNLGSDKVELETRPGKSMAFRAIAGKKGTAYGLLGTIRTGENYNNYVGGIDGLVNLGIDDKIRYQLMYSKTEYPADFAEDLCEGDDCVQDLQDPPPGDCLLGECNITAFVLRADPAKVFEGHGARLGYKHDGPTSLYWLNLSDYAEGFRADLGFDKRTDYRQINVGYGRKWYIEALKRDKGKSRIRGYLVGNHIESQAGEKIEDGVDVWGEFRGSYQTVYRVGFRFKERAVNRIQQDTLALGDNAPLFDESYVQWYYEVSPINSLVLNLDGRYGNIADPDNLVLGKMLELKPRITYYTGGLKFQLSYVYRPYDLDGSQLWKEQFLTLLTEYRPNKHHAFRLLLLSDRTDRDTARFLADEPAFETDKSLELTYVYKTKRGLFILVGGKFELEDDSDINGEFLSKREVYIKFKYDFNTSFPSIFGSASN